MSLFDKAKQLAGAAKDKAAENTDRIQDGLDKVADVVDDKTGGKYSDKIDAAKDKASGLVEKLDDER